MLNNQQILQIAMAQSAIDSGCRAEDFLSPESRTVISRPSPDARRYLELPFFCDLTSYEIRMLTPDDFAPLYTDAWSNALCEKRKHLDRIAAGAYDNGRLIGLAGASADCDTMWQIGIDVLQIGRASCRERV